MKQSRERMQDEESQVQEDSIRMVLNHLYLVNPLHNLPRSEH
jgi:hypothetical protein